MQLTRAGSRLGASLLLTKRVSKPSLTAQPAIKLCSLQHPWREGWQPEGKLIKEPHFAPHSLFKAKWDLRIYFSCPDRCKLSILVRTFGLQERKLIPARLFQLSVTASHTIRHLLTANNHSLQFLMILWVKNLGRTLTDGFSALCSMGKGSLTQLHSVNDWVGLEGPGKLQSFHTVCSAWPFSFQEIFPYSVIWPVFLYLAKRAKMEVIGILNS